MLLGHVYQTPHLCVSPRPSQNGHQRNAGQTHPDKRGLQIHQTLVRLEVLALLGCINYRSQKAPSSFRTNSLMINNTVKGNFFNVFILVIYRFCMYFNKGEKGRIKMLKNVYS